MPDYRHERAYAPAPVCGVDEAGRGPLAGPVVAAAVLFEREAHIPPGLNDSKKLSAARRAALAEEIRARAHIGVGVAAVAEIEALNIWGATARAMERAVAALGRTDGLIALVDGKLIPPALNCRAEAIIGGDGASLSIAAASIIAKTTRDGLMQELHITYPHYGFDRHMGYGTAHHKAALLRHGPCPEHRRRFAPIRALLEHEAA